MLLKIDILFDIHTHSDLIPAFRGHVGLVNPHFWCFFNTAVQCLVHTPMLTEAIRGGMANAGVRQPSHQSILGAFLLLVEQMQSGK